MRNIWKKVLLCVVVAFVYVTLRASVDTLTDQPGPVAEPQPPVNPRPNPPHQSEDVTSLLASHSPQCPHTRRPTSDAVIYRNGYWQTYVHGNTQLYVVSAFYDDRTLAGKLPTVRLLAVSAELKGDVYCQVWYSGHAVPLIIPVAVTIAGRGDKFDGVKYLQSLYSCQLPVAQPAPTHVSLTTVPCLNSSLLLPVVMPKHAPWKHEFGVCVAIAFGSLPPADVVEWMEFHRMLGVTEVSVYDGNLSRDMDAVLDYYRALGVLQVHAMPPPVMDFSKKGVKLSSPASLNDCMLRNMYRYRYMVVVDFDEFIVPLQHDNYTHMLAAIDQQQHLTQPVKSYTFRNAYYFDHFPQDESEKLKTMRFRHHATHSKFLYAGKSFLDPKTCLSVFNHFCYKRFTNEKKFTVDVDSSIASNHHYRTCGFDTKKCNDLSKQQIQDDTILRFKDRLKSRVDRVLDEILATRSNR